MKQITLSLILILIPTTFHAKNIDYQKHSKNMLRTYIREWIATTAHEMGHATAAKILTKSPINVNIGTPTGLPKLFKFKKDGIKITSPFPTGGETKFIPGNRWKNTAIFLAGPAVTILTYYLMSIVELTATRISTKQGKMSYERIFIESALDSSIYFEILENLLPHEGNDGHNILKELFPRINWNNESFQAASLITRFFIGFFLISILEKESNQPNFASKEFTNAINRKIMILTHLTSILTKNFATGKPNKQILEKIVVYIAVTALCFVRYPIAKLNGYTTK